MAKTLIYLLKTGMLFTKKQIKKILAWLADLYRLYNFYEVKDWRKKLSVFLLCVLSTFWAFRGAEASLNTHTLDLNGAADQYVYNSSVPNVTDDMTVECWFNLTAVIADDDTPVVMSKFVGGDFSWEFGLYNESGAGTYYLYFVNSDDGSNVAFQQIAFTTYSYMTWYHVAIAYDKSAGTAAVYKNGSSLGTLTSLYTSIHESEAATTIGAWGAGNRNWTGSIDDCRIWSDIRTGTEIANNYNIQTTDTGNLVAYWQLNNNLLSQIGGYTLTNVNSTGFQYDSLPFVGTADPVAKQEDIFLFE